MPTITRQNTVDFLKKHIALLDAKQEQKMSEADRVVQDSLKILRSSQAQQNNFKITTQAIVKEIQNRSVQNQISQSTDKYLRFAWQKAEEPNSFWPAGMLGAAGGFFGQKLLGSTRWGIGLSVLGLALGAALGGLLNEKPYEENVLYTLELTRSLCEHYPESKEFIIEMMSNKLHDRCYNWAEKHGGWAEAVKENSMPAIMQLRLERLAAYESAPSIGLNR